MSRAEILEKIQVMMKELFELAPERVQPGAKLIDDLELDSLDAIDLAVKVEETTGHAFDEAKLRQLRTIEDVIVALDEILESSGRPVLASAGASQTDR
jgi:acyl carrier protein